MFQHHGGPPGYQPGNVQYPRMPPPPPPLSGYGQQPEPYMHNYHEPPRQIMRNSYDYNPAYPLDPGQGPGPVPPPQRMPAGPSPTSYYQTSTPPVARYPQQDSYRGSVNQGRSGQYPSEMFQGAYPAGNAARPPRFNPTEVTPSGAYYGGPIPEGRSNYNVGGTSSQASEWGRYEGDQYRRDHVQPPAGGTGFTAMNPPAAQPPRPPPPVVSDSEIDKFIESFRKQADNRGYSGLGDTASNAESLGQNDASWLPARENNQDSNRQKSFDEECYRNPEFRPSSATAPLTRETFDSAYARRDIEASATSGMNSIRQEERVDLRPTARELGRHGQDEKSGTQTQDVCTFQRKVTQIEGEIGFAGTDLFFQMSKVVGGVRPQKGDTVRVKAERVHSMPFDWNALSVEVLSPQSESSLGSRMRMGEPMEQIPLLLPGLQPSKPLKSILKNKPPPPPIISSQPVSAGAKSSNSRPERSQRKRAPSPESPLILFEKVKASQSPSPPPKRRRLSSERKRGSPERQSPPRKRSRSPVIIRKLSPPRGFSPPKLGGRRSISPPPRRISPARRSPSPNQSRRRLPSPIQSRRRSPSPVQSRRRSPSPVQSRWRSPSPIQSRRRSPSPIQSRRRSPSPVQSRRRSPSPVVVFRRRSSSPNLIIRISPTSGVKGKLPSLKAKDVSPAPRSRAKSPSARRRRSTSSSRSSSPYSRRRSLSRDKRSSSPRRSPGRAKRRSPSPRRKRSVSPRSRRRSKSPHTKSSPNRSSRRRSRSSSGDRRRRRSNSSSGDRNRSTNVPPPKGVPNKAEVSKGPETSKASATTPAATTTTTKAKPAALSFTWAKSLKDPPMVTGGITKKNPTIKKPKPKEGQLPAYKVVEKEKTDAEKLEEIKKKIQVEKLLMAKERIQETKKTLKAAVASNKIEKKSSQQAKPAVVAKPPVIAPPPVPMHNVPPNHVPNPHFFAGPNPMVPQPYIQGYAMTYQNTMPPPQPFPPHFQEPFHAPVPPPFMHNRAPVLRGPRPFPDMFHHRPMMPIFEPPVPPRPEIPAAQIFRTTMQTIRNTLKTDAGGHASSKLLLLKNMPVKDDKVPPAARGENVEQSKKSNERKPAAPNNSNKPTAPNNSNKPTTPNNSNKPTAPNNSNKPTAPNNSNKPAAPNNSNKPAAPDNSNKHAQVSKEEAKASNIGVKGTQSSQAKGEVSQLPVTSSDNIEKDKVAPKEVPKQQPPQLPEDGEIDDEFDVMDPSVAYELGCHPDKTSKARNWMVCIRCAQRGHLISMCDKQRIPRALPFEISQAKAMLVESKKQHLEEVAKLKGEAAPGVYKNESQTKSKENSASKSVESSEKSSHANAEIKRRSSVSVDTSCQPSQPLNVIDQPKGNGNKTGVSTKPSTVDSAVKKIGFRPSESCTKGANSNTSKGSSSEAIRDASAAQPSTDTRNSSSGSARNSSKPYRGPPRDFSGKQDHPEEEPRGVKILSTKMSQRTRQKFEEELRMKAEDPARRVRPPRNRSAEIRDYETATYDSGSNIPPFHCPGGPVFRISRRRSVSPSRTVIHDPMKAVAVKQLELHELDLRDQELQKEMEILMIQRERMGFSGRSGRDDFREAPPVPPSGDDPFCYVCLKRGHRGRDCMDPGPSWLRTRRRVGAGTVIERMTGEKEPFCLACGKIGHFTRVCHHRESWEVYSDDD